MPGISASVAGEMVGFAVAEQYTRTNTEPAAELLSLYVVPDFRHKGIGTSLVKHLRKQLGLNWHSRLL